MNKARGCFIFFIIVALIVSIFIFIFISSGSSDSTNYLFLGIDEEGEKGEFKGRTDTIIIFSINTDKKTALISVPRDTRVNLEGHGFSKINAAYVYGGTQMTKNEIFKLTGLEIYKTMLVDFEGFMNIVDVLGGVTIKIDEPLHDPFSGADFDPGTYTFNGSQALSFARCRSTSAGDFDRMDRQKYLLSELFRQRANIAIIPKIPDIIDLLEKETKSDFNIYDYFKISIALMKNRENLNLLTLPGQSQTIDKISYVIIDEVQAKNYILENLKK